MHLKTHENTTNKFARLYIGHPRDLGDEKLPMFFNKKDRQVPDLPREKHFTAKSQVRKRFRGSIVVMQPIFVP